MREIERHRSLLPPGREPDRYPWRLGVPALDAHLGPEGLAAAAVHEVKPAAGGPVAGANAAALGFLLRLAARRIAGLETARGLPRILCCSSAAALSEMGRLYGPGLAALGLDARTFLMVETGRETEALWAIEEGLRSGSLALVIGVLGQVALTPARRLSLAAEEYRTPCLLLTGGATPAAGATATRWRVAPAPSGLHPFDPAAPGTEHYRVSLERCRTAPPNAYTSFLLEWSGRAFRHGASHELSQGASGAHRERGWAAA
jgi:protein ImuA